MSRKTFGRSSKKARSVESLFFYVLLALMALAAFNSGNNLLHLIVDVMLGMVFVSLIAGIVNISRISVIQQIPTHVFARNRFKIILEVANNKKFFASFAISLKNGMTQNRSLFMPSIKRKGKEFYETEATIDCRGLYRFPPVILRSRFPLALFNFGKKLRVTNEIVVYPQIKDVDMLPAGSSRISDEFPQYSKGPGSGLYGTRKYLHGEEASNISWKLSAKLDSLVVRETEREERRKVCIVLDNCLEDDSADFMEAFESAVSEAASLAWYLCKNGYSVKLVTRDKIIGYGEGPEQMHKILFALALIEAKKDSDETFFDGRSGFEGGVGVLVNCGAGTSKSISGNGNFQLVINERAGVGNR